MAAHSSTLAWKIPWTKEPGGLQSLGSQGVGHDWAISLSFAFYMDCKIKAIFKCTFTKNSFVCRCVCVISWVGSPGRESTFSWVCTSAWHMGMLEINYVLTIQGDSQAQWTKMRHWRRSGEGDLNYSLNNNSFFCQLEDNCITVLC